MKAAALIHMLSLRNFKTESYTRSLNVGGLVVSRHLAVVHGGGGVSIYMYIYIYIHIYIYINISSPPPPPLTDHALVTVYSWQVTRLRYCI